MILELKVKGMKCTGCENRIQNTLKLLKEVKDVKASFTDGKVTVTLKKALTDEVKRKIIGKLENLDFVVEE